MSGPADATEELLPATGPPPGRHLTVLLYALTGGVLWWMAHLVGLSVATPAVCRGAPHWILTVINVVCALGVLSALAASVPASVPTVRSGALDGRSRFLGHVAALFNAASLLLVVMESIPVYVLGACL